ncbi:hypothetical protein BG46_02065 [Brucella anthropi]|nr:hypothetical protein BG46_02065 [Brucella anthropi]KIU67987.1 hypothetical protein TR92_12760 [Brucella anthropi]
MTILREMFMDVLLAFNVFACNRKIQPPKCATQAIFGTKFHRSRKRKSGQFWGCPDFLRTGINETEGMGRFLQFQTPPYPMPKFIGAI